VEKNLTSLKVFKLYDMKDIFVDRRLSAILHPFCVMRGGFKEPTSTRVRNNPGSCDTLAVLGRVAEMNRDISVTKEDSLPR